MFDMKFIFLGENHVLVKNKYKILTKMKFRDFENSCFVKNQYSILTKI